VFHLATGLPTTTAVTLSATNVPFGMYQVGEINPSSQVQLTNSGTGPLTISSIQLTGSNAGDFGESNNCPLYPNTLAAGAMCTVAVSFTPTHLGSLSAAVSIADNAGNSPQSISLSGTAVDFSVSAVPVSNSIKGGKAASYTVSVAPLGGNTLTASLSVAGCPANTSCTLSASQFALNGSTATKSMLTVKGNGKTPSGTFTLTISGKVFTVTHSTTVTLVVQ
jgi:HYDIN/CFA65/VesB family protein